VENSQRDCGIEARVSTGQGGADALEEEVEGEQGGGRG
jgi:hypothetical protein